MHVFKPNNYLLWCYMKYSNKVTAELKMKGREKERTRREVQVEVLSANPHTLAFHQCCMRRRWWRMLVSIRLIPLTHSY